MTHFLYKQLAYKQLAVKRKSAEQPSELNHLEKKQ